MKNLYPRHIEPYLRQALKDSPVALILGPRQCGKTTLAREVGERAGYRYFTFDDENTRLYATEDPLGFVNSLPDKVILDEAQRTPELFPSLKLSIDRDRRPGRFILTGSVNLLHMVQIKESLAGRMDIIRLHPFSQAEWERLPPRFPEALFAPNFSPEQGRSSKKQSMERILSGGYPPALARSMPRRNNWYQTYIEALVKSDAPTISPIRSLEILPQLLEMAAGRTATLLNVNALASSFQQDRLTIGNYLTLLEKMFLLETIPPWHGNRNKRLVKRPKIHLCDTGIACALLNLDLSALEEERTLFGQILETFVLQELKRQASAGDERFLFYHFRDRDGAEVDIVIQRGVKLAGVEVKASATIQSADFNGLRKLKESVGKHFVSGTIFYQGDHVLNIDKDFYALPLEKLWQD